MKFSNASTYFEAQGQNIGKLALAYWFEYFAYRIPTRRITLQKTFPRLLDEQQEHRVSRSWEVDSGFSSVSDDARCSREGRRRLESSWMISIPVKERLSGRKCQSRQERHWIAVKTRRMLALTCVKPRDNTRRMIAPTSVWTRDKRRWRVALAVWSQFMQDLVGIWVITMLWIYSKTKGSVRI